MQIKMPNGDMVEFPDDMPKDQIQSMIKKKFPDADPNATIGGDIARGLGHGVLSGMGMGQGAPEGSSYWRQGAEGVGETVPGFVAGVLAPESYIAKGVIGAGTGAMQPAKDLKERAWNTAAGGISGVAGQGIGKYLTAHRGSLNKLANEALGSALGYSHLGSWGGLGGIWAGRNIGQQMQNLVGGRGLADLVAAIARNPGLAAQLGIKASPYAEQAGQFVGQELGKPSQ